MENKIFDHLKSLVKKGEDFFFFFVKEEDYFLTTLVNLINFQFGLESLLKDN